MINVSNDYWKDFTEQEIGSKPVDKVEIELSAGVWTDVTDNYIGGATFDQEKERAPDKISAGDTRYTFDNTDDKFTPRNSSSIFYNVIYQGKKIRFSEGFYGLGYYPQSVMIIKNVKWNYNAQRCYIFCQELIQRVVDENLNIYPSALIPIANTGNTGNGTITEIATKPFETVSENWTVTLTGAAAFGVVGSVSGAQAGGTVGTGYTSDNNEIKFTITAGGVAFINGDSFTFTTYQYPEYTTANPVKIAWNLFTGYNFDTDVQSDWHDRVLELDHTKSVDNTDLNYTTFVNAIANVTTTLTGYIPYDKEAEIALEEIIIHFLGSIYTDNEGRIAISSYRPSFGAVLMREFADRKQVFELDAEEELAKIINKVTVYCKSSASFAWSNADETTDDVYETSNSQSITDYGIKNPFVWTDYWYSALKSAQSWFADRIKDKFGGVPNLPLEIKFETGLDALRTNLADRRKFTDARTSYSNKLLEIIKVEKDFESEYKTITLTGSNVGTEGIHWVFLGSSANEGDGISPQTSDFDLANDTDKQFAYLSTTGSSVEPLYYLWGD